MTVWELGPEPVFPPAGAADPDGLLAVGGDLSRARLLEAYAGGIFPWYDRPPILWFSPDPRGVLPLDGLRVSRRLHRTLGSGRFELRIDTAFSQVIRACATAHRPGNAGTWITPEMIEAYEDLHTEGFAHSAEAFRDGRLVGGIYGVSLGRAFFGESMFFHERDASKCALIALAWHLRSWQFELFDTQLPSAHLESLGCEAWPRARFLKQLAHALRKPTLRCRWRFEPDLFREAWESARR
ncbi:MAG: leucyl/phenylalanyl-tRNA--protein transferase [Myxococcota bacterium]|nr:leucyl/phenylalanyl-tRNA--protein transferase [Myxococcota bacterium]